MAEANSDIWNVDVVGAEASFACRSSQHLLGAMIAAGKSAIKVGCKGGGCGICRVKILSGSYQSQKMTRSRISEQDERDGIVLACRVYPDSDLALQPFPLPNVKVGIVA